MNNFAVAIYNRSINSNPKLKTGIHNSNKCIPETNINEFYAIAIHTW
jgi:hypothetical protein